MSWPGRALASAINSRTLATPSYSYAAAGVYTVKLTVTGPGGSNTQTRSNYVTATTAAPAFWSPGIR